MSTTGRSEIQGVHSSEGWSATELSSWLASSVVATQGHKVRPSKRAVLITPLPPRQRWRRLPASVLRATNEEAAGGIEPPNRGFADRCLTTWLRRLVNGRRRTRHARPRAAGDPGTPKSARQDWLERETGFEPATSTLATLRSTS